MKLAQVVSIAWNYFEQFCDSRNLKMREVHLVSAYALVNIYLESLHIEFTFAFS